MDAELLAYHRAAIESITYPITADLSMRVLVIMQEPIIRVGKLVFELVDRHNHLYDGTIFGVVAGFEGDGEAYNLSVLREISKMLSLFAQEREAQGDKIIGNYHNGCYLPVYDRRVSLEAWRKLVGDLTR